MYLWGKDLNTGGQVAEHEGCRCPHAVPQHKHPLVAPCNGFEALEIRGKSTVTTACRMQMAWLAGVDAQATSVRQHYKICSLALP